MMKKNNLFRLPFVLLAFLLPLQITAQEMLVGTYNIRYKNDGDSSWHLLYSAPRKCFMPNSAT